MKKLSKSLLGTSTGLLILLGILNFTVIEVSLGATCNQACTVDADCDNSCKECDEAFLVCRSCCRHDNEVDCIAPCHWNDPQCQNVQGVDCSGIPEVPKKNKGLILWGVGGLVLGATVLLSFRKRLKQQS